MDYTHLLLPESEEQSLIWNICNWGWKRDIVDHFSASCVATEFCWHRIHSIFCKFTTSLGRFYIHICMSSFTLKIPKRWYTRPCRTNRVTRATRATRLTRVTRVTRVSKALTGWPSYHILIFGMSESSGFQKYSTCWLFQVFCLCLCLCGCLCICLCLCICIYVLILE